MALRRFMDDDERCSADPDVDHKGGGGFSIAVAVVLGIMTTGGFGIPMGAIFDDFAFGLKIGAAVGTAMALGVYWFALRNRRR